VFAGFLVQGCPPEPHGSRPHVAAEAFVAQVVRHDHDRVGALPQDSARRVCTIGSEARQQADDQAASQRDCGELTNKSIPI
jgi:hypothetical protein